MTDIPRIGSGHPAGGQFATMKRPEYGLRLTEPLTELEQKRLGRALSRARNSIGNPLSEEVRQRLVAVVTDPSTENWERAYPLVIAQRRAGTMWQNACSHASYPVTSRDLDGKWDSIPTREQLLLALDLGTREDN